MTIVGTIAAALRQAGIDSGAGAPPGTALRRGWDYWVPAVPAGDGEFDAKTAVGCSTAKPDTDGRGMARLPHAYLLGREALSKRCLPVLDVDMDVRQLLGGIWRQCLIRPADDGVIEGGNPFVGDHPDELCTSSRHSMALVGHPPRDLALWLDDLRRRDAALFRLVLAKDFRAAMVACPAIVQDVWPAAVRELWRDDEGDKLPPFLVAVLYAELARVAMNQAGLLEVAFDGKVELTTKGLLDRVGTSVGLGATRAASRAIEQAPFQSLALTPPGTMIANHDAAAIEAWVRTSASSLALAAGVRGGLDIAPTTLAKARFLRDGFAAHPQYQPEARKKKGWSLQPRRTAMFWGLGWRLDAAVRLLEIAETARAWNRQHRPDGARLPDNAASKTANPVARAIVTIRFRWAAEHDPAAALSMLGEMLTPKQKEEEDFEDMTSDQIDPLTVDGYIGHKAGLDLLAQAWPAYRRQPRKGALGYTARARAHLWLDNDGDDIAEYRRLQAEAVREHAKAMDGKLPPELLDPSRTPPEVVALLGWQHGVRPRDSGIGHDQPLPAMTTDPAAASGAQLQWQMVTPLSTDPMWARLLRAP